MPAISPEVAFFALFMLLVVKAQRLDDYLKRNKRR